MKVTMVKKAGGILLPASDSESAAMDKFKTDGTYEIEIKQTRNPKFHGKMFAFFNFCFAHWKSDRVYIDEKGQFQIFRKDLTKLAGFYDEYFDINGNLTLEARSLSYSNMEPEEFEQCYNACVNVAMRTIFQGCGVDVENQLLGFF